MNAERLRLALVGYGQMGRAIEVVAAERGHRVVARIDPVAAGADRPTITPDLRDEVDVAVEFSVPEAAPGNVARLLEMGIPTVSGTTGWAERLGETRALAERLGTGFLWAPNYALGVQVFFRVVERAATWFGRVGGFDPWIFEAHHARKKDAPSGTARRLAELVVAGTPGKERFGCAPDDAPPPPDLVPVGWVRAGQIPGSHRVGWDGPGESIEIVHVARDRGIFARGAVRAAEWLAGRGGAHTIGEMLDDLLAGKEEP